MNAPAVSVVMPVYGTERFLAGAVRSVLAQTYADWELIVLDDSSPGDPAAIMAAFDDPRIRFVRHPNGGPAFTRNQGVILSRGRFVAFLDSDDEWLPEKLARQMAVFAGRPDVDVVYSQRETMDEQGRTVQGFRPRLHEGDVLDEIYVDNCICMSSAVLRREVFDRCGLIDETLRMSEDFDFWLRVACDHHFAAIHEPLVRYRAHPGQVSRNVEWRIKTVWEIRARFDKDHGGKVSPRARRRARALHHSGKGFRAEAAGAGTFEVVGHYLRALAHYPRDGFSWRGLARALAGGTLLGLYRRLRRSRQGGGA